jgi:hypothetical protein
MPKYWSPKAEFASKIDTPVQMISKTPPDLSESKNALNVFDSFSGTARMVLLSTDEREPVACVDEHAAESTSPPSKPPAAVEVPLYRVAAN